MLPQTSRTLSPQQIFFGLTLFLTATYVGFTAALWGVAANWWTLGTALKIMLTVLLGGGVLWFPFWLRFHHERMLKDQPHSRLRFFFPAVLLLWVGFILWSKDQPGNYLLLGGSILLLIFLLPLLPVWRYGWRTVLTALATLAAWLAGGLMLVYILVITWFELLPGERAPQWRELLGPDFPFHSLAWFGMFVGSILLCKLGYFLLAKLLAQMGGTEFKMMFPRSIRILWMVAAGCFLFSLLADVVAESALHNTLQKLARHFGTPLTAEAMAARYFQDETPDPAWWQELKTSVENLPRSTKSQETPMSEDFWRRANRNHPEWARAAALFDRPKIPRYPLQFTPGRLYDTFLPHLHLLRNAAYYESCRARFEPETERQSAQRMTVMLNVLEHDPFLISQLVRLVILNDQLDLVKRRLQAGQLTATEKQSLAADLVRQEAALPRLEKMALGNEAALLLDFIQTRRDMGKRQYLSWLFPQYRLAVAQELRRIAKSAIRERFAELSPRLRFHFAPVYWEVDSLRQVSNKFDQVHEKIQRIQVQLKQEK